MNENRQTILLESGTNELEVLSFVIDEQLLGINVAKVREIMPPPKIVRVPLTPEGIEGIFELRRTIIPVINIRQIFGLPVVSFPETERLIISEFNTQHYAFRVDAIQAIRRFSWNDVQPPDDMQALVPTGSAPPITGIIRTRDDSPVIQMLDFEKIVYDLNPLTLQKITAGETETSPVTVPSQGLKILIAEDSRVSLKVLTRGLNKNGYDQLTACGNGSEAWEKLGEYVAKAQEEDKPITEYVDIIITDIEMPLMDGHHLTKRIKKHPRLRRLPVVLYSSLITPEIEAKGRNVGADYQAVKNDFNQIIKILEQHFS